MSEESKCKSCGEPLVWVGSLLDGSLQCTACEEAESLAEGVEQARLKQEEGGYDLSPWKLPPEYRELLMDRATALSRDATLMVEVMVDGTVRPIPLSEYYAGLPMGGFEETPNTMSKPLPGCHCPRCEALRVEAMRYGRDGRDVWRSRP